MSGAGLCGRGSSWDACLARRAAAIGGVVALVALLVVAATDAGDAGGGWPSRIGMTAALAPLCGALGALVAVRLAAAQGELRALAALGAEPGRAVLGAAMGGSAVGGLGVLVVASGRADLDALFPRVAARVWEVDGAGLRELSLGLRVAVGGVLTLTPPVGLRPDLPSGTHASTLVALTVAALACPAWLSLPESSRARRVGVGVAALGAAVVAFQGVAAGRLPAPLLTVGPLALLTDALLARLLAR